jgi:DivIVA domain-containing protein
VPIKPEEIDASTLPVALIGYKREAVDELLKRVAWDYRQATRSQTRWAEEEKYLKERIAELETQLETEHEGLVQTLAAAHVPQEAPAPDVEGIVEERTAALREEVSQLQHELRRYESRDELIKTYLLTSERTAKELRQSARDEAEAILKAARRRAEEIEHDARKAVRVSSTEIDRLRRLEEDLKRQLQRTLQAVIGENGSQNGEPQAAEVLPEEPLAVEEPQEAVPEPEPERWPATGLD